MFECDEILIKCVQCYPALYSIDSNSEFDNNNKNNEVYWDDIQKEIGIQSEAFLILIAFFRLNNNVLIFRIVA